MLYRECCCVFFFNDTATTEIYTLSLHDALPIFCEGAWADLPAVLEGKHLRRQARHRSDGERELHDPALLDIETQLDRKSTRLNSSHANISYAVFCLKKKYNSSFTSQSEIQTHQI